MGSCKLFTELILPEKYLLRLQNNLKVWKKFNILISYLSPSLLPTSDREVLSLPSSYLCWHNFSSPILGVHCLKVFLHDSKYKSLMMDKQEIVGVFSCLLFYSNHSRKKLNFQNFSEPYLLLIAYGHICHNIRSIVSHDLIYISLFSPIA